MNSANKIVWIALVAVAIIAIGGYSFPERTQQITGQVQETFGALGTRFPNGLAVGLDVASPTRYAVAIGSTTPKQTIALGGSTCNLTGGPTAGKTFSASTTWMHYCAATGVRQGDQVWVTLPSGVAGLSSSSPLSGPGMLGSLSVVGAAATTSDIIGVLLQNTTIVSTSSYTQATTGVSYFFLR